MKKKNKQFTIAESVQGPKIPPSPKTGSKKGTTHSNMPHDIGA